jgi:YggT family protein
MNVGPAVIAALLEVIYYILDFAMWALILSAILSWLAAFNLINTRNRLIQVMGDFLFRLTEPLLRPIRRVVPPVGGLDLSPLILIFAIMFLQSFIRHLSL